MTAFIALVIGTSIFSSCEVRETSDPDEPVANAKPVLTADKSPIPGIEYGDIRSYTLSRRDDSIKIDFEVYDDTSLIAGISAKEQPKVWHEFHLMYSQDSEGKPKLDDFYYQFNLETIGILDTGSDGKKRYYSFQNYFVRITTLYQNLDSLQVISDAPIFKDFTWIKNRPEIKSGWNKFPDCVSALKGLAPDKATYVYQCVEKALPDLYRLAQVNRKTVAAIK